MGRDVNNLNSLAAASSWSGQPIPNCGWTTTLIYEADHTDTVPIPVASADCSSMVTMPSAPAVTTSYAASSSAMPSSSMAVMTSSAVYSSVPAPASSVMVCTEYSDGQPQCSMAPVPACTEYSDGQPQCPSSAPPPPPAPTGVYPTGGTGVYVMPTGTGVIPYSTSVVPAINAAPTNGPIVGLLAAAGIAVAFL